MLKSETGEVKLTKQIRNQNKRQKKNKSDDNDNLTDDVSIPKIRKVDCDEKE